MSDYIDVYGAQTGNCLRVSIALEEAQLAYNVVQVDLKNGQHQKPEHLALNPAGKVPTIIHRKASGRDIVLSQSNAILFYVADKSNGKLWPTHNSQQQAIAYERFFYFITDVIAPSHAAFRLRKSEMFDAASILDKQSLSMLEATERFLMDSSFMAGDKFTLVDIVAFTIARAYENDINWNQRPQLKDWYVSMKSRPTIQRGLKAFDNI